MTKALVSSVAALAAAGSVCSTASAGRSCTAVDLSGSFTAIPGTHAMGSVEYALTLTNAARTACTVSGSLSLQLLDSRGTSLPTHATLPHAGAFTLEPGASAASTAVLAVDVPGAGDVHRPGRPCEPPARSVVVGVRLTVPLSPPASVCRGGSISYRPFVVLERQSIAPALLAAIRAVLVRYPVYEYTLRVRVDPVDASWAEWRFGAAGPQDQVQGGTAFAHLAGGRWRTVWGPGPACMPGGGPPAGVPAAVLRALGVATC